MLRNANWQIEMRFTENQTKHYLNKSEIPVLNIENSVPVKGLNPRYMIPQSLNILKIKANYVTKCKLAN